MSLPAIAAIIGLIVLLCHFGMINLSFALKIFQHALNVRLDLTDIRLRVIVDILDSQTLAVIF